LLQLPIKYKEKMFLKFEILLNLIYVRSKKIKIIKCMRFIGLGKYFQYGISNDNEQNLYFKFNTLYFFNKIIYQHSLNLNIVIV
jgi:hypothetical protein